MAWNPSNQEAEAQELQIPGLHISKKKQNRNRSQLISVSLSVSLLALQGKPPTKKAKVLHKAAWSAKIGAFLHAQGTGQLADGTPTGQDGKTESWDGDQGWGGLA